jgi:hypothetical protein
MPESLNYKNESSTEECYITIMEACSQREFHRNLLAACLTEFSILQMDGQLSFNGQYFYQNIWRNNSACYILLSCSALSLTLKMEAVRFPEISINSTRPHYIGCISDSAAKTSGQTLTVTLKIATYTEMLEELDFAG